MTALLPCPWCNGPAEIIRFGTPRQSCIVSCEECGARLESNENGAGIEWNRRAPSLGYLAVIEALRVDSSTPEFIEAKRAALKLADAETKSV